MLEKSDKFKYIVKLKWTIVIAIYLYRTLA